MSAPTSGGALGARIVAEAHALAQSCGPPARLAQRLLAPYEARRARGEALFADASELGRFLMRLLIEPTVSFPGAPEVEERLWGWGAEAGWIHCNPAGMSLAMRGIQAECHSGSFMAQSPWLSRWREALLAFERAEADPSLAWQTETLISRVSPEVDALRTELWRICMPKRSRADEQMAWDADIDKTLKALRQGLRSPAARFGALALMAPYELLPAGAGIQGRIASECERLLSVKAAACLPKGDEQRARAQALLLGTWMRASSESWWLGEGLLANQKAPGSRPGSAL